MILILFRDGTTAEIPSVEDVVHKHGSLVCVDYEGDAIASFRDARVLAYTLDPNAIIRMRGEDDEPRRKDRGQAYWQNGAA